MNNKIRVPIYGNTLDQIANNSNPVEFEIFHVEEDENGNKQPVLIGVS